MVEVETSIAVAHIVTHYHPKSAHDIVTSGFRILCRVASIRCWSSTIYNPFSKLREICHTTLNCYHERCLSCYDVLLDPASAFLLALQVLTVVVGGVAWRSSSGHQYRSWYICKRSYQIIILDKKGRDELECRLGENIATFVVDFAPVWWSRGRE